MTEDCDSLECWLRSIRRRFQGFEFEITQEAGLSPAFGFIDVQVIELVLQSLLERSREKQP